MKYQLSPVEIRGLFQPAGTGDEARLALAADEIIAVFFSGEVIVIEAAEAIKVIRLG